MIDFYTFATPNGRKVSVMLEEVGLPYTVHSVHIGEGEQFHPDFIKLNPNSKIPVITDQETGLTVFESGAILIYLAEKTAKFLPTDARQRYSVLQWLMFQMGSVGPMFGQLNHFRRTAPEKLPYAINRYEQETIRLYGVLDTQLQDRDYLSGDYSIADMAIYPWVAAYDYMGMTLEHHSHLSRWVETMNNRPAVRRGMAVPS
ncbi:glutathione S-transferase N-terminal domain-containing protein [Leptolyngbya sp. CCY15150]|uniref:glutathione S-transferase N-terminal domain-containing protein n=1 Tax=Leptolyngbya sp. CCY15150 TaxID=2767772 RepID=UPI001951E55B|nr:glutathione S-transferase N-terminal domain-containing protein [Leptolyngbya sp. CCY15150]